MIHIRRQTSNLLRECFTKRTHQLCLYICKGFLSFIFLYIISYKYGTYRLFFYPNHVLKPQILRDFIYVLNRLLFACIHIQLYGKKNKFLIKLTEQENKRDRKPHIIEL